MNIAKGASTTSEHSHQCSVDMDIQSEVSLATSSWDIFVPRNIHPGSSQVGVAGRDASCSASHSSGALQFTIIPLLYTLLCSHRDRCPTSKGQSWAMTMTAKETKMFLSCLISCLLHLHRAMLTWSLHASLVTVLSKALENEPLTTWASVHPAWQQFLRAPNACPSK